MLLVGGDRTEDDVAGEAALDGDTAPGDAVQEPGITRGVDGVTDLREAGEREHRRDVRRRELADMCSQSKPLVRDARGQSGCVFPLRFGVVRVVQEIDACQPRARRPEACIEEEREHGYVRKGYCW